MNKKHFATAVAIFFAIAAMIANHFIDKQTRQEKLQEISEPAICENVQPFETLEPPDPTPEELEKMTDQEKAYLFE